MKYKVVMNSWKIEIVGNYDSDELAWEHLSKRALEVYGHRFRKDFDYAVQKELLLKLYIVVEKYFRKWGIKEVYDIPIFVGVYNDKLTNNNLIDEIRSIHIKEES